MIIARSRKGIGSDWGDFWFWTVAGRGGTSIAFPCTPECRHADQRESDAHHYNASIEAAQKFTGLLTDFCEADGCSEPTNTMLWNPDHRLIQFMHYFCEEHCTKDELRKVHPLLSPNEIAMQTV